MLYITSIYMYIYIKIIQWEIGESDTWPFACKTTALPLS